METCAFPFLYLAIDRFLARGNWGEGVTSLLDLVKRSSKRALSRFLKVVPPLSHSLVFRIVSYLSLIVNV